ncbi:MAG: hypothetical protein ACREIC_33565 [Limisphaerales bacterium]
MCEISTGPTMTHDLARLLVVHMFEQEFGATSGHPMQLSPHVLRQRFLDYWILRQESH